MRIGFSGSQSARNRCKLFFRVRSTNYLDLDFLMEFVETGHRIKCRGAVDVKYNTEIGFQFHVHTHVCT